ncbi:solute carrier family 66 member 3 [Aplysia californica]|uniref:Solute carrier family 66 member 3 n=1 Tax=Aplysia californica TaxID=6500 RepID=A0ABM0JBW2_APLCA|nr:solute carrier family 66 member 3 [Aplysia californica]XP_005090112.1 solute carrier family 66 member 3 [Aplysia californica]
MTETSDAEDGELLTQICEFLSATVFIATFIYKVPQLYVVIVSSSTRAISLPSIVLEWIAYSIMLTYQVAMGYPMYTWAEKVIMVSEDFVLTLVVMSYKGQLRSRTLPYFLLYSFCFVMIVMRWLPDLIMVSTIALTTPILLWSKIEQLYEILNKWDAGRVSGLTWFIAAYCTGVRILTTVVITKDTPMLVNLTSSQVLNVAVFASIVYFKGLSAFVS